jgi:hypothetical protein
MQILLTPIYYNNKKEDTSMNGYNANLKSFSRGSVRNELDFYKEEYGVNLNIQVKNILKTILRFHMPLMHIK